MVGLCLNHKSIFYLFRSGLRGTITLAYITIFLIHVAYRKVLLSLFYNFFLICCIVDIYFVFYYLVPYKVTRIIANVFNVLMYIAPGKKFINMQRSKLSNNSYII